MALSDSEIDAILESGDPDEIERLLADAGDIDDEEETDVEEAEAAEAKPEESKESSTPEPKEEKPAEEKQEEAETKPVVLTKDGKHEIPYEELERARAEARVTKEEYKQAKSLLDDLTAKQEEMTRRLEWSEKQLKKAGIDSTELPENVQLTDEKLDELEENYGELGTFIRSLHAQNKVLMSKVEGRQQQEQAPAEDDRQEIVRTINVAIESNPDLRAWRSQDQDRFKQAVQIDDVLKNDPSWGNKTLDQRFTEVVRRTKAVFGDTETPAMSQQQKDDVKRKADEKLSKAKSPPPVDSLSDITSSNADAEKSLAERLADMSPDQIAAAMDKMTPRQIEEVLGSL